MIYWTLIPSLIINLILIHLIGYREFLSNGTLKKHALVMVISAIWPIGLSLIIYGAYRSYERTD